MRLLKSRGPELDAAAMDAVKQWTFEPGRLNGNPVPVIFNLTVNFTATEPGREAPRGSNSVPASLGGGS